jgi:D-alanyl-lipoteichoic acid acyltransferase DltB (MBOAT superfamily)
MVFPSIEFAIFFPIVIGVSWALMSRPPLWKPFVLVASYIFYGAADPKFCILLAAVTLANQGFARLIHRAQDERRRKQLVTAAVAVDLAVLGVFKYYGFFVSEINGTLDSVGLGLPVPLANIALPIGVSFYIFQAISYVVDLHRRVIPRPAPTIDLAIYLAFFPHVVAGPIVRAREILPQIARPRDPRDVRVGAAVALIAVGLVKKVAIADFLARELVDPVFGVPQAYSAPDAILAAYGFAAQIYCDFSGYTDIAIGVALLMGIVFPQNFDRPYSATSFRDFWRRWHMTLSRYLRDFLYIPLGGNRGGRLRTARNLMLTMLLGGLWHGAAWTFVIWGGIHGAALSLERALRGRVPALPRWLAWFVVFHVVVLAFVFFRAGDIGIAWELLTRMVDPGPATLWAPWVIAAIVAVVGLQLLPQEPIARIRRWFEGLDAVPLGAALALVIILVGATVPSQGVPPFIYFQF